MFNQIFLQAQAPVGSPFAPFILPLGFLAIFYFTVIRPQKKREKEIGDMRSNLKVGDKVVTIGGIKGKIVRIDEENVILETGPEATKFETSRWAVAMKDEPKKEA